MMKDDDFLYSQISGEQYQRVTCSDGVKTTWCENRFEIVVQPKCDVWEQQAVQYLKEWIKQRKEKLREPGDLPE
jgi:hypothetical protein